jgi:hypothetical protein
MFWIVMAFFKAGSHVVGWVSPAGDGGFLGIAEVTRGIFF